ncbi:MAG: glycogen debranching protein GlgX [Nitrospinota bacterium]|nr:glycogen debranching protein GlgX [Nitrospinota bacterium]
MENRKPDIDIRRLDLRAGKPLPLGATCMPWGVNFSLVSNHACEVTLLLYDGDDPSPWARIPLDPGVNRTGAIWHVGVNRLDISTLRYAYRVEGPWNLEQGHRFDPDAILLDPYARIVTGAEEWGGDYIGVTYDSRARTDSKLRCAVAEDSFDWGSVVSPQIPMKDLVIYETHVRGLTRHSSSGVAYPGTFRGLIEKIPYLKKLGVNAVELMPVQEFHESQIDRLNPVTGERLLNYWGYSTTAFFAAKASYSSDPRGAAPFDEFREMVKALHMAGIEVILDVVFNHTAEGDHTGPTLSFRGLDNQVYYMLGKEGEYRNFSGCGNTMNCNHPMVREMIRECLRYWATEARVDGFRFDLASILGRDPEGHPLSNPPLIEAIALDPALAHCKLIAEAWDAGGLYQVGTFPAKGRWGEWNGKYRDCARQFLAGNRGQASEMATRLAGSADLYQEEGRYPYHSINFVTCHDGFTMADMFSYNEKHNEANGEENRDGDNNNNSHNHGAEGPTDNPKINAIRLRQAKNAFTLLMLSQGPPMIYEGDEMGRSKNGNNNSYCHDTELNWLDWGLLENNGGLFRFVAGLIKLRKSHPALGRKDYYTGGFVPGVDVRDVEWHGQTPREPDWSQDAQTLAFSLGGPWEEDGRRAPDIYAAFNTGEEEKEFALPHVTGRRWMRKVYTALASPQDYLEDGAEAELVHQYSFTLAPKSCVVLVSV